ncbi:MAG: YceH family protein [Gemmatimonadetes bacterium]|nr:YceH family protein [Gemmatimonadota bacterium]
MEATAKKGYLSDVEVRILGCLIEKELTTPEYYPLTVNALTNACNQKSNRDPVVMYSQISVEQTVRGMRDKGLIVEVDGAGSRTRKYRHRYRDLTGLSHAETVALVVLMLRGPQTVGEIRGRSGRMHEFDGLEEVTRTLEALHERDPSLVVKLPRQAGRKENRYMHLLAGEPDIDEPAPEPSRAGSALVPEYDERIDKLENEVRELRGEIAALREELKTFRTQFE